MPPDHTIREIPVKPHRDGSTPLIQVGSAVSKTILQIWRCMLPSSFSEALLTTIFQNRIKTQAHEHPRFRAIAARYGQVMHQINMRMSVLALRDAKAEQRAKEKAKEKAETPTVKTEEQMKADEAAKEKQAARDKQQPKEVSTSIWRRKFRPLPEDKAVDLFADVIGDAFILAIGVGLIVYEYVRSSNKPDTHAIKIDELEAKLEEEERRIEELESLDKERQHKVEVLEQALELLKNSGNKVSMSPS